MSGKLVFVHEQARLRGWLNHNPGLHLYSLADLDPFFWPSTSWYGWEVDGELEALALLYISPFLPNLIALADTPHIPAFERLLFALNKLLPQRFHALLSPELEECFEGHYSLYSEGDCLRMCLTATDLLQAFAPLPAVQLGSADLARLRSFYRESYPGNWFDPRMLETGAYLGFEQDGQLVATAGVHALSAAEGIAALGNIAVHPAYRGQGFATQITAALCQRLHPHIRTLGLNVHAENTAAQAAYRRVGFTETARFGEWVMARRL